MDAERAMSGGSGIFVSSSLRILITLSLDLRVFLMDGVQLFVAQLFDVHHLVFCIVDRVNQLIEFQIDCACVDSACFG